MMFIYTLYNLNYILKNITVFFILFYFLLFPLWHYYALHNSITLPLKKTKDHNDFKHLRGDLKGKSWYYFSANKCMLFPYKQTI